MRIGYARVSKGEQNIETQVTKLRGDGECQRIFQDHGLSGGRWDRPELQRALEFLRADDVLVITKLDRISRSMADFCRLVRALEEVGARFESLSERIETHSPAGRMMAHMIMAFAEYEREMIRARTRDGLEAAKARGVPLGRRKVLSEEQRIEAVKLVLDGRTRAEVARIMGVSRSTISRVLKVYLAKK